MYRHKVVSLLQDDLAILEGEAAVHQDLNINRVIYVFTNLYYDISYADKLYYVADLLDLFDRMVLLDLGGSHHIHRGGDPCAGAAEVLGQEPGHLVTTCLCALRALVHLEEDRRQHALIYDVYLYKCITYILLVQVYYI